VNIDDLSWPVMARQLVIGKSAMDDYEDHYVAFIDLLGFKQQVESAERNPSERAHLVELLTLVRDTLGENPYIGFRLNYFSDSIFLTAKRTPEGLWEMFQSIIRLTQNLLQHDVLVRGGLTAGGAHHGRQFLYGTAVNRAVVSEREAKNPMTQVSDEVVEDVNRYGAAHQQWIARDNSGRPFVHYLIEYQVYRPEPIYAGMAILDRLGARIIDFVCQRFNNDAGTILEKAEWLQDYWNETVAVHGVFGRIEKGVTERYDSGGPTIGFRRMYMPKIADQPA
jgi:hypothetical protein